MQTIDLIKQLFFIKQEDCLGYSEKDIRNLTKIFGTLPQELEHYYRAIGRSKQLGKLQDTWMLPEHYSRYESIAQTNDYMVIFSENQGACRCGIRRTDLTMPNPPVYLQNVGPDSNWHPVSDKLTDFLLAANYLEAALSFELTSEFYVITKEELQILQQRFARKNVFLADWLQFRIDFYGDDPNGIISIWQNEEEIELIYAANCKAAFALLRDRLADLGELL